MACEESKTYIAIPPGETIKEQLEIHQMTQKEFAKRMDLSEKHISKLLNGDVMLTQDVARRLEMVLNVPAYFWNNLESRYREKLLLVEQENNLEEETNILKNLPFNEMKKLHWIDDNSKSNIDKIISLRKFFEVSSLSLISLVPPRTAWRRKDASEKSKWFRELLDVQEEIASKRCASMVGTTQRVLLESEKGKDNIINARTSGNIIVEVKNQEILKKIKPEDQVNARQRILSVLDMRKMFPVDDTVYTEVKFNISSNGSRSDNQRTFLMIKEYNFLNDISEDIAKKATKIYEKQIRKNKVLPYHCNYRKLEQALAE